MANILTPPPEDTRIDVVIDMVAKKLKDDNLSEEELQLYIKQLDKLYKMKSYNKTEPIVKLDTLIVVAGNIAGIVLILGFERAHVVTSKALGFVLKART